MGREKEKMTEEEVKKMVENVEGKCKTVKSDMADMAMTEQYLRTKQALLMAKKKEQEMKVAANIAAIREQDQKKHLDKDVEKMKRRESYVEKELIDRKKFEKCGTSLPIVGKFVEVEPASIYLSFDT